jgi:hypothetical protein
MSERVIQRLRKPLKGADKLLSDLVELEYLTIAQAVKVGEYKETSLPYLRKTFRELIAIGFAATLPRQLVTQPVVLYANDHRLPLCGGARDDTAKADQAGG